MTPNWNKTVEAEMTLAQKALKAAQLLLKRAFLEDATSRAYYAVLHAARAALAAQATAPKTHAGVMRMLGEQLVKTGHIEAEYSRMFSAAQDARKFCDYVSSFQMSPDKAELRVHDAARFVERIERYLKDRKAANDGEKTASTVREGPSPYRTKRGRKKMRLARQSVGRG